VAFAAPVLTERGDVPLKPQVVVESDVLVHTSTIGGVAEKSNNSRLQGASMSEKDDIRKELLEHLKSLPDAEVRKLNGVLSILIREMTETQVSEHDVLFCGSNGETVIKALHYPRSVLGDTDGPVLMPSADSKVLLAAYSNEYIQHNVDQTRNIFTDPEVCEKQWELFLNQLAEEIAQAHELKSPEDLAFEQILEN
jgi:hypothetical protein